MKRAYALYTANLWREVIKANNGMPKTICNIYQMCDCIHVTPLTNKMYNRKLVWALHVLIKL